MCNDAGNIAIPEAFINRIIEQLTTVGFSCPDMADLSRPSFRKAIEEIRNNTNLEICSNTLMKDNGDAPEDFCHIKTLEYKKAHELALLFLREAEE